MSEPLATDTQGNERREKHKFSLWDKIMRFSDIGILTWSVIVYIFLYLPIVVLVLFSFTKDPLGLTFRPFTLKWYTSSDPNALGVIHDTNLLHAFGQSLEIAIGSTVIAIIIGLAGSFALERFRFRTRGLWDGLNYTKMVVAEVIAGVSTLLFFVQAADWVANSTGFDLLSILRPGMGAVIIAHVAWNIPFVVVILRARLKGFDRAIEEAGADLGGRPATVFLKVTLPAIAPGILAAFLLSFTLSFDDFVTTFFLAGTTVTTLPILIWAMVKRNVGPEINAISTFMMAFSMGIIVFLELKARISEDLV
jgi:spermidine/putrescine transport system permease protein